MSRIRDTIRALATVAFEWVEVCEDMCSIGRSSVTVQYDIDDEAGGTWHLAISGVSSRTVREGAAKAPDLRVALCGTDWLDLVDGRSSVYSLLASGRLRADGDRGLIGALNLLGLLGRATTGAEVAAHRGATWIRKAPDFVLPRVLFAGQVDHDKWKCFVEQGDLTGMAASEASWRTFAAIPDAFRALPFRRALMSVWWRHRLLDILRIPLYFLARKFLARKRPPFDLESPLKIWGAILVACLFVVAAGLMVVPWATFLLLGVAHSYALVAVYVVLSLDVVNRRAAEALTRLACDDPAFFRFALERRFMWIAPGWELADF